MKAPRFLFVIGVGRGIKAHPAWPDVHQPFVGDLDEDGSWVSWRLTGANHRELGRSTRVFPGLPEARADAAALNEHIAEAEPLVIKVPHKGTWGWRLELDDAPVATSSRSYARHRECAYNVEAFIAAAAVAELSDGDPPRSLHLLEEQATGQTL